MLLTISEVVKVTRLSKPTVYKMIRTGNFPKQLRIGTCKVAWLQSEVMAWIQARAEARAA